MKVDLTLLISITLSIIAGVVGLLTYINNRKNSQKKETSEDVSDKIKLNTKLDILLTNNAEIKNDIKEQSRAFNIFKDDVSSRLIRVEENYKQLDKRVENLEEKNK